MILDNQERILMQNNNAIQWIPVVSKYMIYWTTYKANCIE